MVELQLALLTVSDAPNWTTRPAMSTLGTCEGFGTAISVTVAATGELQQSHIQKQQKNFPPELTLNSRHNRCDIRYRVYNLIHQILLKLSSDPATDNESQTTDRAFSITVSVAAWSSAAV